MNNKTVFFQTVFGPRKQIPVADQSAKTTLGLQMEMKESNKKLPWPTKGESPKRLMAESEQIQFSRRFGQINMSTLLDFYRQTECPLYQGFPSEVSYRYWLGKYPKWSSWFWLPLTPVLCSSVGQNLEVGKTRVGLVKHMGMEGWKKPPLVHILSSLHFPECRLLISSKFYWVNVRGNTTGTWARTWALGPGSLGLKPKLTRHSAKGIFLILSVSRFSS